MKENWLFIKTPDHYGIPEIIQFDNNEINYFIVEKDKENSSLKIKVENRSKNLTEIEHQFINQNRIRFFEKGKTSYFLSDDESITEDSIFENDYQKLNPTETKLTEIEIQSLKFELNWNGEKNIIRFNEDLDPPYMQEINKRMNRDGRKILLERLNETLFVSLYENAILDKLIPIKYVHNQRIILYGFPKEPYEIDCQITE
ncbi:hypothetical protein [Flavobacterium sp. MMS24-S5]|uniref:hypothetical protein n=1 Tax=Flavobacterium sp. MMS24-S5 TaxID=3416605 RepID=UPI003D04A703